MIVSICYYMSSLALLVTEQEVGAGKHQMIFASCHYMSLVSEETQLSYTVTHHALGCHAALRKVGVKKVE